MSNLRKWTKAISMVTSVILYTLILRGYSNRWVLLVVAVIACMANSLDGWIGGDESNRVEQKEIVANGLSVP